MSQSKENKTCSGWFKAKRFGWGWTPCSWEGWAVMLLYLCALVPQFIVIDQNSHSNSDTLIGFAGYFIPLTIFFLVICYLKGEKISK